MKPVLKSLVLAMTAQALLFAGTQAMAAEIGDRTIRFGYGVPEEHPIGQGVNKFAELVGQKSGGKIKVRKGLVFNDVSPQEIDRMRQKLKPVVDKYAKEIGEELVKQTYAEIDKIRKQK